MKIKGSTGENFMRYHNVTLMAVETLDDLIRSLKDETVEAAVYDAHALMYIAKEDSEIKVVGEMFDVQKYGVAFPQGGFTIEEGVTFLGVSFQLFHGIFRFIYHVFLA